MLEAACQLASWVSCCSPHLIPALHVSIRALFLKQKSDSAAFLKPFSGSEFFQDKVPHMEAEGEGLHPRCLHSSSPAPGRSHPALFVLFQVRLRAPVLRTTSTAPQSWVKFSTAAPAPAPRFFPHVVLITCTLSPGALPVSWETGHLNRILEIPPTVSSGAETPPCIHSTVRSCDLRGPWLAHRLLTESDRLCSETLQAV